MTTTLNFPRDNFDQDNTFVFAYQGARGIERQATGYLFQSGDQGIFIQKKSAFIADSYTEADRAESARLAAQAPLRTGDEVTVEGKQYKVRILGNYSDAGRLIPV